MSGFLDLCVFELAGHKVAIPLENAREFQRLPAVFPLPGALPVANIAVMFTSGYTEQTVADGGGLPEGSVLLSKPYRRADLAQKLQRVLARRR